MSTKKIKKYPKKNSKIFQKICSKKKITKLSP